MIKMEFKLRAGLVGTKHLTPTKVGKNKEPCADGSSAVLLKIGICEDVHVKAVAFSSREAIRSC